MFDIILDWQSLCRRFRCILEYGTLIGGLEGLEDFEFAKSRWREEIKQNLMGSLVKFCWLTGFLIIVLGIWSFLMLFWIVLSRLGLVKWFRVIRICLDKGCKRNYLCCLLVLIFFSEICFIIWFISCFNGKLGVIIEVLCKKVFFRWFARRYMKKLFKFRFLWLQ